MDKRRITAGAHDLGLRWLLVLSNTEALQSKQRAEFTKFPFGIVLDAASTYTSIYLYHWPMNTMNGTGVVSQLYKCDVDGNGISSFANDPAKAGQLLRPCLDKMLKYIPPKEFQETNIFLGATDGMRLLELQNQSQSRIILDVVQKTIQSYPFHFCKAVILTGAQEGAFGWTSVNYLLKSFLQYSWEGIWIHPEPIQTFGLLDLGSSSTQLTFIPKQVFKNMPGKMNIHLYGYNYTIYTQSYPCYGQQQSIRKYIATLLKATSGFFHVFQFLNLTSVRPSLYKTKRTIEEFCTRNWKEVDAAYPNEKHEQLRDYCISANYIYILLVNGYEFNSSTWENIVFDKKIGQTDIGWTLGYMLNHTNMISSKPPGKIKTQSNTVWSSVSSILGLTTLLSVLVNVIHFKQKAESKIQPLAGKFHCAN
ncbi:ectonucleoside triphosphate diphosphohydrolase 8-like [Hemiscyllium ocellatum]|uniref:ectonucleoside triphosphate diphosphohydrolase 8-like n=1 Tax=Hemiscyllium ocellatum TaxID=170820 RepID=UPI00296676E3|nr:ectonucleoside triphosphate diphosphohydrolase 8-like [Hemiscyllium ocellatum]